MIPLPPGCAVTYSVWVDVTKITKELIEWYKLIGGRSKITEFWNSRGQRSEETYLAYGNSKWCHYHQNGFGGVRLHFHGDDASVASMLIIKFFDIITNHNLKEVMERKEKDLA
jgi:hypothetical protein